MPHWPLLALLVLLFTAAPRAFAADIFDLGDLYFESVGKTDTFEGGLVTAMLQDQQGFMWFGSYRGLLRYDGYRFTRFEHQSDNPHAIGGNYIRALALGLDGRIWIGTFADGVSVYNPKTNQFTNYRHNPNDNNSLANNRVDAIIADPDGRIWLGTNNGLNRFDPATQKFEHFRHIPGDETSLNDNHIRSLLIDTRQRLWVGSWNGVNRLADKQGVFENPLPIAKGGQTLAGHIISSMFQDSRDNLWFGSYAKGLSRLSKNGRFETIDLPQNLTGKGKNANIKAIAQINQNHIWLATYGKGIIELNIDTTALTGHFTQSPAKSSSVGHNQVAALLKDQSGLLWVGTWGGGLNRVNASNNAFRTLYHLPGDTRSLSHQDIGPTLALPDGTIWVGTRGNGIDVVDPAIGVIEHFRPDPNRDGALTDGSIKALAQSDDGAIWVGTISAGLFQYQAGSKRFKQYDKSDGLSGNTVRNILPSPDGNIWIATGSGLNRLNSTSGLIQSFSDDPNRPLRSAFEILAMQQDGTLWASANNGLYLLEPGADQLLRLSHDEADPQSISHNNTIGLLVDSSDTLWVATSAGINRLSKRDGINSRFENVNQLTGHPVGVLGENLLEDSQGRIWTGQMMINPKNWHSVVLSQADGISNNGGWLGAYGKSLNGTLLYGGNNGLVMIKPENFKRWHYQPPLVISKLKLDGIPQPPTDSLTLPAGSKTFSLEFSALDYSAPQSLQYRYRLEGFDSHWLSADHEYRVANYTNLDPGTYRLTIEGTNRLGDWSPNALNLTIIQLPAWYQTVYFKTVMLLLGASVLYLLFWARLHHLEQSQQKLQYIVGQRTEQLLQAKLAAESASLAKSNFLAAMSHEIRTPMNAVLGYSQLLQQDDTLGPNHKKTLSAIEKAGNHLIEVINDILDISKIEAGNAQLQPRDFDLSELIRGLDTMLELRCKQKGIDWQLKSNVRADCFVHGDAPKLRQVLINLLGNAYKFTDQGGLTLTVATVADNRFRFIVADTGPGMTEQEQQTIFEPFVQAESGNVKGGTGLGLSISQSHIHLMKGTIALQSTPGEGSEFSIEVPLPKAQNQIEKVQNTVSASRMLRTEQPVRVMIIDSDTQNRDILQKALIRAGIDTMVASHGEQALGPLSMLGKAKAPQLIFMDMQLSNAEDVNTFEQLKAKVSGQIKLVAMTTSLVDGGPAHFIKMGFEHCIGKPYRFEQIYQCISELLNVEFIEQSSDQNPPTDNPAKVFEKAIAQSIYNRLMTTAQTYEIASLEHLVATLSEQHPDLQPLLSHLKRHIDSYDIDDFIEELETIKVEQDA